MAHISTVLVVDDMPAIHQMIRAVLRSDGYRLEFATSGYDALAKAAEAGPDLVLLDVMMPGMDGFETCRQLRTMPGLAEVPIIMITALADRASRLKGIEAGADDFISKPFDQTELRARVRSIIRLNRYRRLLAERSRYQRLVELSPDGIAMIDEQGVIQFANSALLAMLGCQAAADLLGQPLQFFVAPAHLTAWKRFLQDATNPGQSSLRTDSVLLRSDGSAFPAEITAGWLEWNSRLAVQIIARDTTERKLAEETLQQRNRDLALLNRAGQVFSASLDLQAVVHTIVSELSALFATASASVWLLDDDSGELMRWHAQEPGARAVQAGHTPPGTGLANSVFTSGQTLVLADAQSDEQHLQALGEVSGVGYRSVLCVPLLSQSQVFGVLALLDSAPQRFGPTDTHLVEGLAAIAAIAIENALLFRAVNSQRGQLRALAGRLAEVQEQERQHLARELHDQIGQNLTALNLNMSVIDQALGSQASPEIRRRLTDTIGLVSQTAGQVRTVMAELRPPVLDDYGLPAALRWYGEQFTRRTGVVALVTDDAGDERFSSSTETALFRIAQEALNNVAKHAAARQVVMSLQCGDGLVRLTIADDGQGFDPLTVQKASRQPHWGLLTMQERAMAVGGTLHVVSQPGAGTRIIVEAKK